ncbi:fluoride efflux transporter CrcB [Porticoccus sp.]|uniref:fluoride efflux transporter CrcB n=1 Tax=Porticoccus sp. TaxID=2024853 RepID=UPI000C478C00|nr:fluoride efflux transporter CrcB [Porticoccus sp.]MAZ69967.1 fluoride efflux transporter CrcB [Porticoccus sp.]|tara:strand:+ start:43849 stop:44220 length:372 start_codon:yes stop_codon:yes gene_type:complete
MQWLVVAAGGALGAMARFGINSLMFPLLGNRFPLGTLLVNVAGSVLMGVFYVLIIERGILPAALRDLLMVGFIGAFTTFSAFSLDTLALWQNGHLALAGTYVFLSIVLCLAGTLVAIVLTRLL